MSRAHLQDELVCLLNRPEAEVTTFLEDYFFAGHDYLRCYQNGLLLREKLMIAMADRAWQIFCCRRFRDLSKHQGMFADFVDGVES